MPFSDGPSLDVGLLIVVGLAGMALFAIHLWRRGKRAQESQDVLAEALASARARIAELERELAERRPPGAPSDPNAWSEWRKFPDPRRQELLTAPFGPGCYELRDGERFVLYGRSRNVAARMSSILAPPLGCGSRHNDAARDYVGEHLDTIEYRTLACASEDEAREQAQLMRLQQKYLLND